MTKTKQVNPVHGPEHHKLAVFLGDWKAEGTSYGATDQTGANKKANGVPWTSTHTGRWHTGEFFLIQDERAHVDGDPFDTLAIIGFDPETGGYFVHNFENHGFYRHYDLAVDAAKWMLSGDTERATITFSDDNRRQDIVWEYKPDGEWLPLCDRVATKGKG
jgi:hypothetical protein